MTNSCKNFIDYTGKQFNCWTVLRRTSRPDSAKKRDQGEAYWLCEGACGKRKVVRSDHIIYLETRYPMCHHSYEYYKA